MTVYREDGKTEHAPAQWPYRPASMPEGEIGEFVISNLTFTRDRDKLVVEASGGKVSLDESSIRAIGAMMMRLANDIENDRQRRSFVPNH